MSAKPYRERIEDHLYRTNYYWHDGAKMFYSDGVRYEVAYNKSNFSVRRLFISLEEAKIFNTYCLNNLAKAKYNESKGIINFKENTDLCVDEYPDNLLKELDIKQDDEYYKVVLPYFDTNFNKIKTCLNPREQEIIESYFRDLKTFKEIGEIHNITNNRVMQIVNKALRKISVRKNIFYETEEKLYLLDQAKEQELIEESRIKIDRETAINMVKGYIENGDYELATELTLLIEKQKIKTEDGRELPKTIADLTIDDLELTMRTRNCLIRAGYKTYKDIPFDDIDSLIKIRNLGRKSLREMYIKKDELEGTKNSFEKAIGKRYYDE